MACLRSKLHTETVSGSKTSLYDAEVEIQSLRSKMASFYRLWSKITILWETGRNNPSILNCMNGIRKRRVNVTPLASSRRSTAVLLLSKIQPSPK